MLTRAAALLSRYDWLILLLLLPLVLFPTPGRAAAWLLLPLLLVARRKAGGPTGRFLPATAANTILLLLALMILISTWATPDLAFSVGKVISLTHSLLLFFAVVTVARRGAAQRHAAVGLLLLGGLGVAGLSLLGAQWAQKLPLLGDLINRLPQRLIELPGSPAGGFSPNQVAGVLLWIAPLALALSAPLLRRREDDLPRWLAWFALPTAIVLTGTLLLTQSRAGYLGLATGLALMGLLALTGRWRRSALLGGGLLLLLAIPLLIWQGDALLTTLSGPLGLSGGAGINSLEGRVEIWSRAIYGLEDFPLTGMGMNSFRRVIHILYPLFLIAPTVDIAHAHNQWLQAGLDLGLPGLIAYLALWLVAIQLLWRQLLLSPARRTLATGILGALAAAFVYGLFDAVALGARPGFLFWALLGIAFSLESDETPR